MKESPSSICGLNLEAISGLHRHGWPNLSVLGDHKTFWAGTHRVVDPLETLKRVLPHLPRMGITRIANITGLDVLGIPVVMVSRPNSRSVSVAQGKGITLEAAKASAIMEALETYHAERFVHPPTLATYAELKRTVRVTAVHRLPQSSGGQFSADRQISWTEGRDLVSGDAIWVPSEIVHTDYTLPLSEGGGSFPANTNGLASGNHALEAITHGICEVIERDAITLWMRKVLRGGKVRTIDPKTIDDPACCGLIERLQDAGVDLRIWDVTSDVGVPVFYCLILGGRKGLADPEYGSGCHPARAIALARALTEAAQARITYIAGVRDDFLPGMYAEGNRLRRLKFCSELIVAHKPEADFQQVPTYEAPRLYDDVNWLIQRLCACGMDEVIIVDLSNQEINLPVFRTIVPGLEGPDKGESSDYVPGQRAKALDAGSS